MTNVCQQCSDTAQDVRQCALCWMVLCRHNARKGTVRKTDGKVYQEVMCKEWSQCIVRAAEAIIH